MKNKEFRRLQSGLYTALLFVLTSTSAHAADTDVYLNQTSTVLPNIMFSIDTSGSMTNELDAAPAYSSSTSYSGVFENDKVYISSDGRIPSETNGVPSAPIESAEICDFAVTPLADDGFTGIRAAIAFATDANVSYPKELWIPSTKVSFDIDDANDVYIECSDDSGNHGLTNGVAYANSGTNSLYTAIANSEIDWDKFPYVTLFTGHYLNYKSNPPADVSTTRAELQQRVISDAIKRTPDIMTGLTRFRARTGGVIIRGLRDNSVRANQQDLLDVLEDVDIGGATPLAESLLEVLHYYHGLDIYQATGTDTGETTDPSILSGNTYISPISHSCQKNYVITVTDGGPTHDTNANSTFKASNGNYPDYSTHTGKTTCAGNCLDEMAGYMAQADASPLDNIYDLDGSSLPDPQTVKVYPIGMEIQEDLLDDAAAEAGTESYYATNALEFELAFIEILAGIKNSGGLSMVTASSSNDRFSKTNDREFLYYGQFVPSNKFQWNGNIKKYRYAYNSDGVAYVTDTDLSNPDITADDGSLASTARSYWSTSVDGNNALEGGVLDLLKSTSATGRNIKGINSTANSNVHIMTTENELDITDPVYIDGVDAESRTTAEREQIRDYALGQDVHDADDDGVTLEQRGSMGGIVRSSPVAVQYGGTSADPDVVIFATTTDGVLHAFDDEDGEELWAIVMPEAYPFLAQQHDNYYSTTPWWGIDGSMVSRVVDNDQDGIIEVADDDKVFLYISGGMSLRRWFILDVTNAMKNSDQAILVKRGKYDANETSWDELGLALAQMVPIRYRKSDTAAGEYENGVIYANGWDPAAEFSYEASTMGRGISLYDADDGTPVWQQTKTYGGSNMDYAFATQPTPVDINGDGYTDLIYAIDVNAQIWRFNVNNGSTSNSALISGGKLATLGTDTDTNRRRAYKRIDAAVINNGINREVILAVGTGDRMNPLSSTDDDRLYAIRDTSANSGTDPATVLTESDLYDATDNLIGDGSVTEKLSAQVDLSSASGWFVQLPAGDEKAISAPLISAGIINFPVYQRGGIAADPCEDNSLGNGLLYRMNILDATPVSDYSGDGSLDATDRSTTLRGGGIPGDVHFHTSASGIKTIIVNRDTFVNNPDEANPNLNATPDSALKGDAAGYWFEQ